MLTSLGHIARKLPILAPARAALSPAKACPAALEESAPPLAMPPKEEAPPAGPGVTQAQPGLATRSLDEAIAIVEEAGAGIRGGPSEILPITVESVWTPLHCTATPRGALSATLATCLGRPLGT